MVDSDGFKMCPGCQQKKLAARDFYRIKQRDGFSGYCRLCHIESVRRITPEAIEKARVAAAIRSALPGRQARHRVYMRAWNKANPDKVREYIQRRRARDETAFLAQKAKNSRLSTQRSKARDPEFHRIRQAVYKNRQRAKEIGRADNFTVDHWQRLLAVFAHACAFCGAQGALLDVEHLVAMRDGGDNVVGNIVPSCRPCNAQKYRKSLEKFVIERRILPETLQRIQHLAVVE